MKSSFLKHDLLTWHWHCNIEFWIGAGFGKERFILTYTGRNVVGVACATYVWLKI